VQVDNLPDIVQEECNQFLDDFREKNLNLSHNKYKHKNINIIIYRRNQVKIR
jgi:hypothetical protein